MKKNKLIFIFLLLTLPLLFTYCKKDKNGNNNTPDVPVDPKAALWNKWWCDSDTASGMVNFILYSNKKCKYFDELHDGNWQWIGATDTMQVDGITQPNSWRMFFRKIEENKLIVSFDFDGFLTTYNYKIQQ